MAKKIIEPWEQAVLDMEKFVYGTAKLIADGYNLSFQSERNRNKIIYLWFIDGVYKGSYYDKESEVGAKFGLPIKFNLPKANYEFERIYHGKKSADALKVEYGNKIHAYKSYYPSARSIILHLKKTCTSITLNDKL